MAHPTPVQRDMLITVKITLDEEEGKVHKKVKIPYSVLTSGLSALEAKLRDFLVLDANRPYHFERFSDSAADHIPLVHTNPSVYRQLMRAAKAKQKLKLRVVYESTESMAPTEPATVGAVEAAGPRPVTIEDVPEPASSSFETAASAPAPTRLASPVAANIPAAEATSTECLPTSVPVKASSLASTPRSDPMSRYRKVQDFPNIPGHFPESRLSPDATTEKQIRASMQSMAQNQDFLDRNLSQVEASISNMSLNADSSESCYPAAVRVYPFSLVDTYNALVNSAPAAPALTPAAPAASVSTTSTPHPVRIACTRDAQSACLGRANVASSPDAHPGKAAAAPRSIRPTLRTPAFTVCCNSCERKIPDTHFHCSTCEGGDFDLCDTCIKAGITCHSPDHWMIRRNIQNGLLVNSFTERIQPKRKFAQAQAEKVQKEVESALAMMEPVLNRLDQNQILAKTERPAAAGHARVYQQIRTCNNCILELPEREFLHCSECSDFDLCKQCFVKNDHGHHPKHSFEPAIKGTEFSWNVTRRLNAGRGYQHHAVCDSCERFITGVRHKCSDCPDWDYCSDCILNAEFAHPGHRFIPIYEPLVETALPLGSADRRVIHKGTYCDGPHCVTSGGEGSPIRGDRYKCAVCDDLDFCATCEASPSNLHNKTHPLIKFRTPVRHVSVTTMGEHSDGRPMPSMGDQVPAMCPFASSAAEGTSKAGNINLAANKVQTVIEIKPTASAQPIAAEADVKVEVEQSASKETSVTKSEPEILAAAFQRDTVADGTVFAPNHVFEQTWVLRNTGTVAWPAGCCVRFVSGDYMGHVDPNHPAGIKELMSAFESTICYQPLAPGAEFPFTVLLRAPSRVGKAISFWRLTTPGDVKVGDEMWCHINVLPKEESASPSPAAQKVATEETESSDSSQMIYPKLEKESPIASIHEAHEASAPSNASHMSDDDELDDCWADDGLDDGFTTDEEYEILDASDEESLAGDKLRKEAPLTGI
ncbi:hypothetical protein SEPCBS119000_006705 [Sporothrix epigloea]|uniref:ZZ-type domain-containing protein n=1 Tax=Sporothrix epigloea TaxID=1892477 RepID=A0ABP0E4D6_9PEZI